MLTREVLRAIRQIVGAVDLAGMDIVEVSPPYDQAETTAMAANRCALEAISALAVRAPGRRPRPLGGLTPSTTGRPLRALARLYDLDLTDDPGDLDLYLALAAGPAGPSWSWRPGAAVWPSRWRAAGNAVTAVDLDPAMLARARAVRGSRRRRTDDACRSWRRTCSTCGCRTPAGSASPSSPSIRCMLLASRDAQRRALPDAGRPPRSGRRRRRGRLAPGCRRPRPFRRPDHPRVAADRSRDRAARDEGRFGHARRGDRDGLAHDDLRGRRTGRARRALGPERPASAGVGGRAPGLRRGGGAGRGSSSPADTGWSRWAPAASVPSSWLSSPRPAVHDPGPPGDVNRARRPRGIVGPMAPKEGTRLLVVEDVPQVAQYIRGLLNSQSHVKLVDVLTDGARPSDQSRNCVPTWSSSMRCSRVG